MLARMEGGNIMLSAAWVWVWYVLCASIRTKGCTYFPLCQEEQPSYCGLSQRTFDTCGMKPQSRHLL